MPTPTYTPLATVTLGSAASSVTFSSIPATYRDLIIVYVATGTSGVIVRAALNGSTADGSTVFMGGDGTTFSGTDSTIAIGTIDGVGNSINIVQFMDYTATDKHKTILSRSDRSAGSVTLAFASRWAQTTAINSISVQPTAGTMASGGIFSLYGIVA
jgi:hypothetical protein